MASKKLTISAEAYERLKKHKLLGESFSHVILREIPDSLETAGDVFDYLKSQPAPKLDLKALASLHKGRGRRSNHNWA